MGIAGWVVSVCAIFIIFVVGALGVFLALGLVIVGAVAASCVFFKHYFAASLAAAIVIWLFKLTLAPPLATIFPCYAPTFYLPLLVIVQLLIFSYPAGATDTGGLGCATCCYF